MNANEARKITKNNENRAKDKLIKKSNKQLKDIYFDVRARASKGHSCVLIVERDLAYPEYISKKLKEDGYNVYSSYPYMRINW